MAKRKIKVLQSSRQSANSVIIETPRGCRNKYRCDKSGRLKLSKMPEGMIFLTISASFQAR